MKSHAVDLGGLGRVVENFTGTLHWSSGDLGNAWVRIEYEEYEPSTLKVTLLHLDFLGIMGLRNIFSPRPYDLRMTCQSPSHYSVSILPRQKSEGRSVQMDRGYEHGDGVDTRHSGRGGDSSVI